MVRRPRMLTRAGDRTVRSRAVLGSAAALALVALAGCGSTTKEGQPTTTVATASASTTTTTTTAATTTTTAPTSTAPASTGAGNAPADPAAARAEIVANWAKFFSPASSLDEREALLENGAQYRQALEVRSKDPLQKQASAKVTNVEFTAPDEALVTYDVSLNGKVALPAAQGMAVLQDGVWKVAGNTFCSLISLGATAAVPGCS